MSCLTVIAYNVICFQKLKQRQQVLTEAASSLKWTSLKLLKVKEVLAEEYMSLETSSSADESDCEANSKRDSLVT